ncbi:alpha/beta hydrolase [Paractinoplanes ferrugineus]|uniref:Peptidase n=1 Tax=Paractinoplanes ferrugineus TaxID=113564 RepID=A0A919M9F2_9ACTN|nr:alpha/beta hydrolase [Actinoplanes ferrugineus]GIE11461.1 peptidase [Actinoplanes ferrugineus]
MASFTTRLLAAGAAGLALAGTLITPSPVAAAPSPLGAGTVRADAGSLPAGIGSSPAGIGTSAAGIGTSAAGTGPVERRRVDSVVTPKLSWYSCYGWGQCATAKVPLDYDRPDGEKISVALLRVRARDQKNRIGSLFVNPGGPGGSGVSMALAAPYFLSEALLDRFDVVGMDPRGIGFSDRVTCFADAGRQAPVTAKLGIGFPWGAAEEKSYLKAAGQEARACSTTGRALAGAMSTAEVARDLDVMRRAVGDSKLTYLGFSYGTALGQYYANMFPDRFRAIVVDGVIDPRAWVGTASTAGRIQDDRLHSADGAYRALAEILRRCSAAGSTKCAFSAKPMENFRVLAERLKNKPLTVDGVTVTYAAFIGVVLGALYEPTAGAEVTGIAADLFELTTPGHVPGKDSLAVTGTEIRRLMKQAEGRAFPYDNSFDAYSAVMCTDGRHPAHGTSWPRAAARADQRAPYFGRAWAWASAQCAADKWTVRDEDAYTGPFNRHTKHPLLIVGSLWDPATNYADAVSSSKLLPDSRLLSSDNWGHTAYGTSACATGITDRYLLYRALPAKGTTCVGDAQPFRVPLDSATEQSADTFDLATASPAEIAAHGLPSTDSPKQLPPVR